MPDGEGNLCRRIERVGEILKKGGSPGNVCGGPDIREDLVRLKGSATVRTCEQASPRIQIQAEREGLVHPAVLQRPCLAAIRGDIWTVIRPGKNGSESGE